LTLPVQERPSLVFVRRYAADVAGSTRVKVGRPSNAVLPVGRRLTFW
jgi:hypothetical protein